jgi:hypothetical protein
MMEVEYTKEEYNRLFRRGEVKTPIKIVKMGSDQFAKLARKDGGARQSYIGAAYQTLTDPVVVIKEGNDDVYIKSFKNEGGISTFMSVEKDKEDGRFVVTNYKRKRKEIENKIKKADGIIYLKDDSGSPARMDKEGVPHAESSHTSTLSPDTNEKSSGISAIHDKYQSAKSIEGDDDEIQVGKETIPGKWKLVEADTPTASHDEQTFNKTKGFPANADGSTVNDRDYEHDKDAQEMVMEIGGDFDGRAVSVDNPVVVTSDGVVISGNNRTMSSKIAARKGADKKYIETLKKRAKKFGFTAEQIGEFKNPRVIFETAENDGYSTDQFAKFNKSSKKAMNPIESAVKVSKTIKSGTIENVASKISEFDTLGELYADNKAVQEIFDAFQRDGVIAQVDRPQYVTEGGITGGGKEFMETVLIGSVMNEKNIRGLNREGCKSIRQKLVRAITPLIENKGMKGYSVSNELNSAVDIAMQVAIDKKFKDVEEFSKQNTMFESLDPVAVQLAKKLEGTQKGFAEFMQSMNGGMKYASDGEADIFFGGVESKEQILSRMLDIKKAIGGAIEFFRSLQKGNGPRFVKKSVPVLKKGIAELEERWIPDDELATDIGINNQSEDSIDLLDTDQKTIAIDFDGVINSFSSGWRGSTKTDAPVAGAADAIGELLASGNKIVIYSSRAATPEGLETIKKYLGYIADNNVNIDEIDITDKKPIAHVYVDDRAISFNGDWQDTLKQIEEFKPWTEKSLTYSGHPLQGRTKIHGMDISIENKKGSDRSGIDKDGHEWNTTMNHDYGYIRGTVGRDKDHVDCYIGPNPESENVFIVHQNDPVTGKYDEDKVMLGFDSEGAAQKAYLKQYDRPGFLGDISAMDIDTFKIKAFDPKNKGRMLS